MKKTQICGIKLLYNNVGRFVQENIVMSFGYYTLNNNYNPPRNINFRAAEVTAPLAKPIEKVQKSIETVTDTFIKTPEGEESKKSKKATIGVISSVLVLSGIIAALNPKFSNRWITKLKHKQTKAKIDADKNNTLSKVWSKILGGAVNTLGFINNFNSMKDLLFKKICSNKILKKPHEAITNWFDSIGKHTVQRKYKSAGKKMDYFETLAEQYKDRLPEEAKRRLQAKLKESQEARNFFSKDNITGRFKNQENLMSDLESRTNDKIKDYFSGLGDIISGRKKNGGQYIKENMSFWAEDLVKPQRDLVEKEGQAAVEKLIGNTSGTKGTYNEIMEIMNPFLGAEEKNLLEKSFNKASKRLKKANYTECTEYFDKKRDLMLGGAPTDIVTGAALIGLGGVAIGKANSKDEKISKSITVGAPAVLGVVTSIVSTAMLFSGVQGMLIGSAVGGGLNILGNAIDRYILGNKPQPTKNKSQEVLNA